MKNPTQLPVTRKRELLALGKRLAGQNWCRRLLSCGKGCLIAFLLSAAATGTTPLPLALGYLAGLEADWSTLAASGGACVGYLLFWGIDASLESLAGVMAVLLAAAFFAGTELRKQIWFLPALCGTITAVLGLAFLLAGGVVPAGDFLGFILRVGTAIGSALIFGQVRRKRGTLADAAAASVLVLGLCQVVLFHLLDLGLAAAALAAAAAGSLSGLPLAALCGLAVDLSRITPVPVTPIVCISLLCGNLLGRRGKLLRLAGPALWSLPAMYVAGALDPCLVVSLGAGGLAAALIPDQVRYQPQPEQLEEAARTSAELEAASQVLSYLQEILQQELPPTLGQDAATLFDHAANQVCRSCTRWEICWEREAAQTFQLLDQAAPRILEQCSVGPKDLPAGFLDRCRRPEAFISSVNQAISDLRLRRQCRARLQESRQALCNQYRFLSQYLQETARQLDPGRLELPAQYRVELGVSATGKFGLQASGDRGAHFPGPNQRYYVVLCDGMGTGPGAAQEGESALHILTGLLQAGMPPSAALETLNDLYVLRETGGFSTADLLEIHLDTGRANLYKWGAAPSYLKYRRSAKVMGTAAPPPGVGIGAAHRAEVIRLSLQRGEMIVLVSDGLEGEETQSRIAEFAGQNPRALAATLVAQAPAGNADDATAVAVRLCPLSSPTP